MSVAETLLDTPYLEKGIRYVNFFNGRQLSAEDLLRERDATRQHQQQLARGGGSGIIDGLHVVAAGTADAPSLKVTSGLAVNRQGQVLSLPEEAEIKLRAAADGAPSTARRDEAGLFGDCKPPVPQVMAINTGLYLLLIGPASGLREHVPKVGLRDDGVAARCDFAWDVEGVQFTVHRLEPKGLSTLAADARKLIERLAQESSADGLSVLRDQIAHAFLGTEAVAAHYAHVLLREQGASSMTTYGEMDALWKRVERLACDVPLAILLWTDAGLHFVDVWGVRRRLAPRALSRTWPVPTSERRQAEGEAVFFHFQDQLADLLPKVAGGMNTLEAPRYFRYLPPAGVLPLGGVKADPSKLPFFAGRTVRRPVFVPEAVVEPLLRESLAYPPIDLMARDDRGRGRAELLWLYQVRENERAKAERYLIFATGHMPYYGHARFDLSWWDYSNYSSLRLGAPGA